MEKRCKVCDKMFEKPSNVSVNTFLRRQFCSRPCFHKAHKEMMKGHLDFTTKVSHIKQSETLKKLYREGKIKIWNKNLGVKPNSKNIHTGRTRAKKLFKRQPCRICNKKGEIHHIDGNTLNNNPDNIDFLCRSHHMITDQRSSKIKRRR